MPDRSNDFVQLERSFHELEKNALERDEVDLYQGRGVGRRLSWQDLLEGYRTVILSEAGTGKTEEIRQITRRLQNEGKAAFFLRLQHLSDDFEIAFEEGTFEAFESWLSSSHEAWLLLDSIDEARLRHPDDFKQAIRKLGSRIRGALDRVHIILTGRPSAWRAKSDLELCEDKLPMGFQTFMDTANEGQGSDSSSDAFDPFGEEATERKTEVGFRIVALDELSESQIKRFVQARGVNDPQGFMDDLTRADARAFAARPQDLEELLDLWKKQHHIGSRLELMQNSVRRRLEERDQDRGDSHPLPVIRAEEGARLLAAAATLAKESTLQVPDGAYNKKGIAIKDLLPDWDERDINTLLSRPLFDEAIYGTVRFHHRSVREFLAAEWFVQLLQRSASRRQIENLLFREQYGVKVVVPTLRPLLPWLAIRDGRILERMREIAPEVIFEGGDPKALPLHARKSILSEVCKELASGKSGRSALEYDAVQRFASPDLAEEVRALLKTYASNSNLVNFLIRMVWMGRMAALKDEAKSLALSSNTSHYTRIAAIRALHAVGTPPDLEELRTAFAGESPVLNRDVLSEIVLASKPTGETIPWFLDVLAKAAPKERYSFDLLEKAVTSFAEAAPMNLLPQLTEGLNHLMGQPPFVDRGYCDVSELHAWLMKTASIAVERLIRERHLEALGEAVLSILHKLKVIRGWSDDHCDVLALLGNLVPAWPELNRAAFWHDVRATRQSVSFEKSGRRLTDFWQASGFGASWAFGADDFDESANAISTMVDQDDKLVALSLAFNLYEKSNRPSHWLERLQAHVSGNVELAARLEALLNPPVNEYEIKEKRRKESAAAGGKHQRENLANKKAWILANIEGLRAPASESTTDISNAQRYLQKYLREQIKDSHRWIAGRWRELIPEFGEEVARAYREGAISTWRNYRPTLRSEGASTTSVPFPVEFGLVGLEIEAAETPEWPSKLEKDEVLLACRYAAHDLSGFPPWFPRLFDAHPQTVGDFLIGEIRYEVASTPGEKTHHVLTDISWSGEWAWDQLAPALLEHLRTDEVSNVQNLERLLNIVKGCSLVSGSDLATLARLKLKASSKTEHTAIWMAVWVGVAPDEAIPVLRAHLSALTHSDDQTHFAMKFAANLLSGRHSEFRGVRDAFHLPKHLKELFLLMHTYIREDEDNRRLDGKVFHRELRDDAQDARDDLLHLLRQKTGKEAFIALSDLVTEHPNANIRPSLASYAKERAEQDADLAAWSPTQVREFHECLDRTPKNPRELFDHTVMRFLDLKADLENGDESVAGVLQYVKKETEMRNFLACKLRNKAQGRYTLTQEEELADAKRPDLRFHGAGFDAPVPAELKLAERWSGSKLFERLKVQLSGDYLRDTRSSFGIYVLVNRTKSKRWKLPTRESVDFERLIEALEAHWKSVSSMHPHVTDITVIGIDLSKRFE